MSQRLKRLRDQAAEPVLQRIRRDRDGSYPRLHDHLDTIAHRLFDLDFDVAALWRETGTADHNASTWFADLDATPLTYITEQRLQTAARLLLLDRKIPVWKLPELVGFGSLSNFNRTFKRRFGLSPERYREETKAPPEDFAAADLALAAGAPWAALDRLAGDDAARPAVAARLGLAWHGCGADKLLGGHFDVAYDHLCRAREHYAVAGELPPSIARQRLLTAVSCKTDNALLDDLCFPCRGELLGDAGASLRQHLRNALQLLPLDLEWFDVCCEDCYRVVWKAVPLARLGFLDDAWKAWWLVRHADLAGAGGPPSVGRFLAYLSRVEGLDFPSQADRLAAVDRALAEARALRQPLLESEARYFRGNVLRAMARFSEASEELKVAKSPNPWLRALHGRFSGILEQFRNDYKQALVLLRSAANLYKTLDPHVTGLLLTQQGSVYFELGDYERDFQLNREALSFLDNRRDPVPGKAGVPISLAVAAAHLGGYKQAEGELDRCCYDREAFPSLAANEVFTRGCLSLIQGYPEDSLRFFTEASRRFDDLGQPRDAALAVTHSVEASYDLGRSAEAIEACASALRFFEAAGCPLDTLEAVANLQVLVREKADARSVAASARKLARRHGGWLPDPA